MPRLLLIEDDVLFREALAGALEYAGHSVVQAGDGLEGVALFRAHPADLVITDLVMPNREGVEVITELRRDWPALPIIAMSGSTHSPLYLTIAARLGASRTLAKPFTPVALLQLIDELLPPPPRPPATR